MGDGGGGLAIGACWREREADGDDVLLVGLRIARTLCTLSLSLALSLLEAVSKPCSSDAAVAFGGSGDGGGGDGGVPTLSHSSGRHKNHRSHWNCSVRSRSKPRDTTS